MPKVSTQHARRSRTMNDMPTDVLCVVLRFLTAQSIARMQRVCVRWKVVAADSRIWNPILRNLASVVWPPAYAAAMSVSSVPSVSWPVWWHTHTHRARSSQCVRVDYMHGYVHINSKMRRKLVNWLILVQRECKWQEATLLSAVNLLDRFLVACEVCLVLGFRAIAFSVCATLRVLDCFVRRNVNFCLLSGA